MNKNKPGLSKPMRTLQLPITTCVVDSRMQYVLAHNDRSMFHALETSEITLTARVLRTFVMRVQRHPYDIDPEVPISIDTR
jgi:hypothetical protein